MYTKMDKKNNRLVEEIEIPEGISASLEESEIIMRKNSVIKFF